jgi:hypothetical protein
MLWRSSGARGASTQDSEPSRAPPVHRSSPGRMRFSAGATLGSTPSSRPHASMSLPRISRSSLYDVGPWASVDGTKSALIAKPPMATTAAAIHVRRPVGRSATPHSVTGPPGRGRPTGCIEVRGSSHCPGQTLRRGPALTRTLTGQLLRIEGHPVPVPGQAARCAGPGRAPRPGHHPLGIARTGGHGGHTVALSQAAQPVPLRNLLNALREYEVLSTHTGRTRASPTPGHSSRRLNRSPIQTNSLS